MAKIDCLIYLCAYVNLNKMENVFLCVFSFVCAQICVCLDYSVIQSISICRALSLGPINY